MEGGEVHLETSEFKGVGQVTLDTSKMMFVFAGSFPGLKRIIRHRNAVKNEKKVDDKEALKEVKPEDLMEFGISREFLGRIEAVKYMDSITKEMLMDIMITPKNSIFNQYQEKIKQLGVQLEVTEDAIEYISEKALENGTGARGLAGIIQGIMEDVLFELPEKKNVKTIRITKEAAMNNAPVIEYTNGEQEQAPAAKNLTNKPAVNNNAEVKAEEEKAANSFSDGSSYGDNDEDGSYAPLKSHNSPGTALTIADVLHDNIIFLEERYNELKENRAEKTSKSVGKKTGVPRPDVGDSKFEKLIFQNTMVNSLEDQLKELIIDLRIDKDFKIDYTSPEKLNYPIPTEANVLQTSMDVFDVAELKQQVEKTIKSLEKIAGKDKSRYKNRCQAEYCY